jgi:hypothetical protein
MNLTPTPPEAVGGSTVSLDDALKALCRVPELTESQFGAFRRFYDTVRPEVRSPKHEGGIVIPIDNIGLPTNESVVRAVKKLRSGCEKTAEAFSADAFPHHVNQEKAVRQTVKLAYLIDPASQDDYPNGFRFENEPIFPVKWELRQTFKDFFNAAFPVADTQEVWTASSKQTSLKAWKLHQRLKLQIVRTNDLAEHLVYNPQTKSLAVFHQVEWLKAQISHTKNRKLDETVEASLAAYVFPISKDQLFHVDVRTLVEHCPRSSLSRPSTRSMPSSSQSGLTKSPARLRSASCRRDMRSIPTSSPTRD